MNFYEASSVKKNMRNYGIFVSRKSKLQIGVCLLSLLLLKQNSILIHLKRD